MKIIRNARYSCNRKNAVKWLSCLDICFSLTCSMCLVPVCGGTDLFEIVFKKLKNVFDFFEKIKKVLANPEFRNPRMRNSNPRIEKRTDPTFSELPQISQLQVWAGLVCDERGPEANYGRMTCNNNIVSH